ncbi:DUF4124 domain-containing protein [Paraferrimonas haliotis]|uniref:Glycosyl transferase n=1 Tax=Paraferrimonas haliotis TaxID=2013866 RepID=A0AA37TQW9_9GAMM|nr:DUF4124 domain-containing protein [Paraferrimonas haliotis]GLS82572.1 glycosyl transferase [Paraferrimonas haliotis]
MILKLFNAPILISLVICSAILSQSAQAQTIYRWVDEEGKVHFEEHPPVSGEYERIESDIIDRPGVTFYKKQGAESASKGDNDESETLAQLDLQQAQSQCANAQYDLDVLQSYQLVREKQRDGSMMVLDDEQKQRRINKVQARIDKYCPQKQ